MTTQRGTETLDEAKVEEFVGKLVGMYVGASLTLMIDVGYRTGLWEALTQGPATSEELAQRAGLNERYVREWLGAVSTGGIVEYDPADKSFSFPPEHAACLTGDTAANFAVLSPIVTFLGKHVPGVVDAFRNGGGIPYSEFRPEFTAVMDDMLRRDYDESLFNGYIGVVPGLADRLEAGISVCDFGCGTGHNMNLLGQAYPNSTFVGYDIAEDAIELARTEASEMGVANVSFEVQDVVAAPGGQTFDLVTAFDSIHDQADPQGALNAASGLLNPDGLFLMIDVKASSNLEDNMENPLAPLFFTTSTMHCMTVSLAEGGTGLGNMWGEQKAREMLDISGLSNVRVIDSSNPINCIYICTK